MVREQAEGRTKIFVCSKRVDRAGSVVLVDRVKPCDASLMILWSRLPILTVQSTEGRSANHTGYLANREKIKRTVRTSNPYLRVFALHRC